MAWEGPVSSLLSSALLIALAAVAVVVVQFLERRIVSIIQAMEPLHEGRRKQLLTLVTTIRWVVVAFLVGSVTLMVLSNFVDVTPVLASVGVVGLALSLGAQTLIKDVIGGLFILVENQYAVDDVIKVADTSGRVERITLRSTYVRDLDGSLHIVPNGEVRIVSNLTREWSRAMVDFGVAYEQDLDEVLSMMESFAQDFADDPEFAPLLVEKPEIVGPISLENSSVTVRVMATTKPGAQWTIEREIQKRVLQVCDREGIELPYPRQEILLRNSDAGNSRLHPE